jgi:hypothetical protein
MCRGPRALIVQGRSIVALLFCIKCTTYTPCCHLFWAEVIPVVSDSKNSTILFFGASTASLYHWLEMIVLASSGDVRLDRLGVSVGLILGRDRSRVGVPRHFLCGILVASSGSRFGASGNVFGTLFPGPVFLLSGIGMRSSGVEVATSVLPTTANRCYVSEKFGAADEGPSPPRTMVTYIMQQKNRSLITNGSYL